MPAAIETHLSFVVLATVSLDHCECAKTKQVPEYFHLQRLPILYPLREIHHCRCQMFFVDGLIRRVQHSLDGINCMGDISLNLFIFCLFAQLLYRGHVSSRTPWGKRCAV